MTSLFKQHRRPCLLRSPLLFSLTSLLCTLSVFLAPSMAFAAAIGDHVEFKATHQAGVPLHQEPCGTNDFQRVPGGTQATVSDTAKGGQWQKLSLPDGRTGWLTSRYVASPAARAPSTTTSPTATTPQRIEAGTVVRVADGDTLTVLPPNPTQLRIRMYGRDAPATPKGTKFAGQPFGKAAAASLKPLAEGKRVKLEIYEMDRERRLLATIFFDGKNINRAMIEAGLAEVSRGPESGNPYQAPYHAAEHLARAARKGMWVLGDRDESPRMDRKRVGIS
jgi:endonuclease YncB( thermonuclease family)